MLSALALTKALNQGLVSCGLLPGRCAQNSSSNGALMLDVSRRFLSGSTEEKEKTDQKNALVASSSSLTSATVQEDSSPSDRTGSPGSKPGLRSLSEVLGHDIQMQAPAPTKSTVEEELDPLSIDDGTVEYSVESPALEPDPTQEFVDPKYGFAVVGGVIPKTDSNEAIFARHPRLHPNRSFQPGQAYKPQDLNPFAEDDSGPARFSGRGVRRMPSASEVRALADFKNVQFLEKFLSPAGRLLPRKETKLPVTLHHHVMRQIKIARTMGLIAGEARLDKLHVRKMRELGIMSLDHLRPKSTPENPQGA